MIKRKYDRMPDSDIVLALSMAIYKLGTLSPKYYAANYVMDVVKTPLTQEGLKEKVEYVITTNLGHPRFKVELFVFDNSVSARVIGNDPLDYKPMVGIMRRMLNSVTLTDFYERNPDLAPVI